MSEAGSAVRPPSEREIFLTALECETPARRTEYLDRVCAGNPTLRESVQALLAHHVTDAFLETPALAANGTSRLDHPAAPELASLLIERPGARLGPYRLMREIAEGGCGMVFLAEQETPVRREVALKVLKPGMDTRSVIARFEQERQALALMDHPNIARVFDAGTTPAGRPFFVMELVRGIKITEFCDAENLSTRERLELFIQVCRAIQHAHQKGVIHRDIKPSNILVTLHDGQPVPKVIDFGVAKALGPALTDKTLLTDLRFFLGTPAYTSPEQAEQGGTDVDTRADIYSLGVLLYELLTGTTPFDPRQLSASGLDHLRRTLRETEPERPSERLRTLPGDTALATARRQQSEPARLIGLVRGDLDWIVMTCLEKDRARRYDSATALAADVQRYLDNEPVLARPPSRAYRFRKFARRNRGVLAATAAVSLTLLAGVVIGALLAYRAVHAEREEAQLRQEAEAAQAAEMQLRQTAEQQELAARRRAYAADINLLHQALDANNLGRARQLLDAQRPETGGADLRGWEWRHLWQQCRSDALFTLCQQSNEVFALAASPDGRFLAVSESGGSLSVWDLRSRESVLNILHDPGRPPIAFSPVAPLLALTTSDPEPGPSRDPQVRLWDAETREYTAGLPLSGPCRALAFTADGAALTCVTADGTVTRWNHLEPGPGITRRLPFERGDAYVAAISPDHGAVAFSRAGGTLVVADLATGATRWSAHAADEMLTALAFSPDGRWLATGAGFVESAIRLWDANEGREIARLAGHRTWVGSLAFWSDRHRLVSTSADQTLAVWDLRSAEPSATGRGDAASARLPAVLAPQMRLRGHQLEVWSVALLPDGRSLFSGAKDGTVLAWDLTQNAGQRERATVPATLRAWALTAEPVTVVGLDDTGQVGRWAGPGFTHCTPLFSVPTNLARPSFSPSGRFLVAGTRAGSVQVWPTTAGVQPREIATVDGAVSPVAFQSDADLLVTQQWPGTRVHAWDLATGEVVRSWSLKDPLRLPFNRTIAVSRDWLVWFGAEGSGRLLNLQTGQETPLDLDLKQVTSAALSADGSLLAAVSRYGVGGLWEIPSGLRLAKYSGVLQAMVSTAFSPTGQRLAIGSDGGEAVKLWDLASHQELLTLAGEGSGFSTIAFSRDGTALAAGNREGRVHVWHAPTWAEIISAEAGAR